MKEMISSFMASKKKKKRKKYLGINLPKEVKHLY